MDEDELEALRKYVEGVMSGELDEVEIIRARSLEATLRTPLQEVLEELAARGRALALGQTPRAILEALEAHREAAAMPKSTLAERAGLSRGHLADLLRAAAPRPTMETILRLAIALNDPLEVVDLEEAEVAAPASLSVERPDDARTPWGWIALGIAGTGATMGIVAWLVKGAATNARKGGAA